MLAEVEGAQGHKTGWDLGGRAGKMENDMETGAGREGRGAWPVLANFSHPGSHIYLRVTKINE